MFSPGRSVAAFTVVLRIKFLRYAVVQVTDIDLRAARDEVQLAIARVNTEHVEIQSRVAKEEARREAICTTIESKSIVIEKGAGWTPVQLAQQAEMQALRSELHIDLDAKRGVVTVLRRDVDHLTQAIERSETAKAEIVAAIAVTQAETQEAALKTQRLSVLQKKQSSEMKELQSNVDKLQRQLTSREEEVSGGAAALVRAEASLKTRKQLIDKGLQEYNALHSKTVAMTDDLDAELVSNEAIVRELRMMEERTAAFRAEERTLLAEAQRAMALTNLANAKLAAATQSLHEVRH